MVFPSPSTAVSECLPAAGCREMFEVRFEDTRLNRKYFANFEGDGLRYELGAFLRLIHGCQHGNRLLTREDSMFMADVASRFRRGYCVEEIS